MRSTISMLLMAMIMAAYGEAQESAPIPQPPAPAATSAQPAAAQPSVGTQPPGAAPASQTATAPANAAPQSEADRLKAMEARITALEGQVQALTAALSAATPAAAPSAAPAGQAGTPQPSTQAPTEAAGAALPGASSGQPVQTGGAYSMAKALNPDISAIGDFVSDSGRNPFSFFPGLELHEAELGFQAIVDPYARADFFISFGEQGVDVEEGYITFTALPHSFVARAGKMRSAFGKVNTMHNHVLPWIDRPLVTYDLVGAEDGIDDAGVSIERILPAPKWLFLEATGQIFRGDSGDVFSEQRKSQVSTVAHLRGYHDINDNTNLDVGLSFAHGHNDANVINGIALPASFYTNLYGIDATLRWKPLQRAIYHSFIARTEFIWNQRQQLPFTRRAFGWYGSADYQFARRWFIGGRYDWSDHQRNGFHDSGGSVVLTYWPSEFAQIRGQFRHTFYGPFANVPLELPLGNLTTQSTNELLMQVQFSIGAHGAHPF